MKKMIKMLLLGALFTTSSLFADASQNLSKEEKFNRNLTKFIAHQLPLLTSLGMNDATSSSTGFPFFTVGLTGGVVLLPSINSSMPEGLDGLNVKKIPLSGKRTPFYSPTIFGRLGLLAGFDIGLKLGMPIKFGPFSNFNMGGEIRYSILEEGLFIPGISIAAGADYSSGKLEYSDKNQNYGFGRFATYDQKIEWSQTNLHLTAKTGLSFFINTIVLGFQAYQPIGTVKSTFKGRISDTEVISAKYKENLSKFDVKLILGTYFNLPFVKLGGQYDYAFIAKAHAFSVVAQFVL